MGVFGHMHLWRETSRTFIPPVNRRVNGVSEATARDMAFGYTLVELRCVVCGKLKTYKIHGDVSAAS